MYTQSLSNGIYSKDGHRRKTRLNLWKIFVGHVKWNGRFDNGIFSMQKGLDRRVVERGVQTILG
jgi:hypothetical protein